MDLEGTLTSRDSINTNLRGALDEATGPWGIRVARVEIKAIDPPLSIQDAMEKQMRADRDKRAIILSAEGQREAAIKTAEGQKAAQILSAEGQKTAAILSAEADRQSRILRAEGEAKAIALVAEATADAIRNIATAAVVEGGIEALQMQVAKSFIDQWGNLAKTGTTMIIPADLGNIGGMVGTALGIVRGSSVGPNAPPRASVPTSR